MYAAPGIQTSAVAPCDTTTPHTDSTILAISPDLDSMNTGICKQRHWARNVMTSPFEVLRSLGNILLRYGIMPIASLVWGVIHTLWSGRTSSLSNNHCVYPRYIATADTAQNLSKKVLMDNYRFYANEIPSRPDGDLIDNIHTQWWGNYEKLERHHGFIQWLFPIREQGLNSEAQELQKHEAEKICADPVMHNRVLKSYELMLDFYGMKLKDRNTGEIERSDNWKERFDNLNHSSHNYLRITRILKCLGEMNYEHLKAPFLRFVLHEAIVEGTLDRTLDSCMKYWVEVLRGDQEREDIKKLAQEVRDKSTIKETSMKTADTAVF